MSTDNANGDWKPNAVASVNGVYDYNQYTYPYTRRWKQPTTKRTVTTTYEYDEDGKVVKQTVVEETVTEGETYDYQPYYQQPIIWNHYNTT